MRPGETPVSVGATLAPGAQRRWALRERLGVRARALLAALEDARPEPHGCKVSVASRLAARALAILAARRVARAQQRGCGGRGSLLTSARGVACTVAAARANASGAGSSTPATCLRCRSRASRPAAAPSAARTGSPCSRHSLPSRLSKAGLGVAPSHRAKLALESVRLQNRRRWRVSKHTSTAQATYGPDILSA